MTEKLVKNKKAIEKLAKLTAEIQAKIVEATELADQHALSFSITIEKGQKNNYDDAGIIDFTGTYYGGYASGSSDEEDIQWSWNNSSMSC